MTGTDKDGKEPKPNQRVYNPKTGMHMQVTLGRAVKMWPTPHGFTKDGKSNGPSGNELGRAVNHSLYPTPTADPMRTRGGSRSKEPTLDSIAKMFPSPDVGMAKGRGQASADARRRLGGSLNPQWVEWLMGYPSGWTDLRDSETP